MSRAGKFIPGGGGKTSRTGPIRAPEAGAPSGEPGKPGKKPFAKGSLVKPVSKRQRLPIVIMSGIVCCILVSVAWYTLAYLPQKRDLASLQQRLTDEQTKEQQEKDAADAAEAARKKALETASKERGTLTVDSNPTGATATIGDFRKTTPASFTDIVPGTFSIVIQADGYEDYKEIVSVSADKPTDLGVIQLVPKSGNLSLTSPQAGVTYKITGPNDYAHEGQLPDTLDKLPTGDYVVKATQQDWMLPPITFTIHDHDNLQKEIKFPYASLSISSTPSGATVREGRTVLGTTPFSMAQTKPGDLHLSVDLPPYTIQRLALHVPDFGNVNKQVTLQQGKDFIAACGMPMVWVPDGGFWSGKYQVRQSEFEAVAGYNPSNFRGANRPVESISWESAVAFCDKLNDFERKAGKIPQGFHYSLPKESQWEALSANADIEQAATSRMTTLSSTKDAGYSEPNKYGIYDSIGNVWEWCLDNFDDKGDHTLRGGCWLSSMDHFPNAETRSAGPAKYADQFTGFRVVLVAN